MADLRKKTAQLRQTVESHDVKNTFDVSHNPDAKANQKKGREARAAEIAAETKTSTWWKFFHKLPAHVQQQVAEDVAEAEAQGRLSTKARRVLPGEKEAYPYDDHCRQVVSTDAKGKNKLCYEPVTHVRYGVSGPAHLMQSGSCDEHLTALNDED